MKRHRPQKPTRQLITRRPTLNETIREFRRLAVADAEKNFKGTFDHGDRQEWAESRKGHGWSHPLVDEAIGGGPFALVRAVMHEGLGAMPADMPTYRKQRTLKASQALAKIESGKRVECGQPKYTEDSLPLNRRTYAPPRLRLPV